MTTTGRGIVTLCLAACCVCTANAYEDTGAVADRIQSAGRGAHLGHELCGYTSAQVADYKERLRRSLSAPACGPPAGCRRAGSQCPRPC